jgi:hypothetical protein
MVPTPHALPISALIFIWLICAVAISGIIFTTNRSENPRPVVPAVFLTLLAILEPFISPGAYVVAPVAIILGVWLICAELRREELGRQREELGRQKQDGIETTLGELHKHIARGLPQGSPKSRALAVSANLLGFLAYRERKRIASKKEAEFYAAFSRISGVFANLSGEPSYEETEARGFCKEYLVEHATQVRDVYDELKQHGHESTEIEEILRLISPKPADVQTIAEWLEQSAKTLP